MSDASSSQQIRKVQELQSLTIGFRIKDENGDPVPKSQITSLTMRLIDRDSGDVINSRDGVDSSLDALNVTMGVADGRIRWSVQPADNVIVDTTADVEVHVALFTILWGTEKRYHHEAILHVRNLHRTE
jgi:hypothetical protein